jgi:hypothetical protein
MNSYTFIVGLDQDEARVRCRSGELTLCVDACDFYFRLGQVCVITPVYYAAHVNLSIRFDFQSFTGFTEVALFSLTVITMVHCLFEFVIYVAMEPSNFPLTSLGSMIT